MTHGKDSGRKRMRRDKHLATMLRAHEMERRAKVSRPFGRKAR